METRSIEIPKKYYDEPFLNRLDGAILSRKSKHFDEPLRLWIKSHGGVIRYKHETTYMRLYNMLSDKTFKIPLTDKGIYAEFDNIDNLVLFKLTWI